MDNQNKKAKETGSNTDHIMKIDEDQTQLLLDEHIDKTELLVDDEVPSPLHSSDSDEKTESLSNFDELDDSTEILINSPDHQEECNPETGLSANPKQYLNVNSEELSHSDPVVSNQDLSVDEEPTEELQDEVTTKTPKRKKFYIALGAIAGICLFTALAFLIPAQMKASEINKSLDLGEKFLEEGKYEEAILAFDDVIAIEPKQVAAYEGKGSANIGLKNYTEAETQLETAKTIDYTDNGKVLMSDVYINTERKDLGKALLDEVTNHNPEETRVIVYASKLYSQLNEYTKVIELLEKKIASTTDQEELKKLYDELINATVKSGKTEAEILALLERAAKATGDQSYLDKKASYAVKKPSFGLAPGEYQGTQSLEIIKGSSTDKVYYTVDGSEPNVSSTEYTTPISLQPGEITIKMIAVNEAGVKCPVAEGQYVVKQTNLTNEEFINKIYGVWYVVNDSPKYKYSVTYISNRSFMGVTYNLAAAGGINYEVVKTTQNGGTIKIPVFQCSDSTRPNEGVVFVDFDFGEPNDNKISYRTYGELWGDREWSQDYATAEALGNNLYQLPFEVYEKDKTSNIVQLREWIQH